MPVPGPGGEKARQIQNIGTYIQDHIQGDSGTTAASDYETFASNHPGLSAGAAFLGWLFTKIGPAEAASLGLGLASARKAANQIAAGTVSGLDKTGQNKIDQALGSLEKLVIGAVTNPLSGLNAIGAFFDTLEEPHTWMRIVEGLMAIGLIIVAGNALIKKYTGVSPVGTVAKVVK